MNDRKETEHVHMCDVNIPCESTVDKKISTETDQSHHKKSRISSMNADQCPQEDAGLECVIHRYINSLCKRKKRSTLLSTSYAQKNTNKNSK